MPDLPRISIVTPSFNSAGTIAATIESVQRQDYGNWEHIVVDGGSTDGTVAVLQRCPRLVWTSEKDAGHYDAMNKGIARATGDAVVILNADDCFRPGALGKVAAAFRDHPDWDALFGDVVFVDGEGREIYRREEALYDYKVLLYGVDYICHQALFVRKSVYDRLGGYRQKEFRNSADYEFKLRLGRAGCRVGHVPELLVDYRYHAQGQSADLRIIRNMIQEAVVIRREHGNPGGWRGACLRVVYKAKRQLQKLRVRHKCDLIPGNWLLKSHLREKTQFSSNAGLDKL
ncbi:MAG TPA: glycosyltransferase family 2 protein [Candidatus Acidoferrum sp.]|nr:glycosyltransferase family 2 protein [Candidatus Acidoferrum sp.]